MKEHWTIQKQWRDDRGGKWGRRVIWYESTKGRIRLRFTLLFEGNEREEHNLPCADSEAADAAWEAFKSGDDP